MINNEVIIFVGNARDYHTIDWCRAVRPCLHPTSWVFITDCIESEGHRRLVSKNDCIKKLFIIDRFLLAEQSVRANIWRNIFKLLLSPLQAILLRIYIGKSSGKVIHAHTFYYGLICRLANYPYLFTPQGGELTERPTKSFFYRHLMIWVLRGARFTFVDSDRMRKISKDLGCDRVEIFQYGIDTAACHQFNSLRDRFRIISNRGVEENYRIEDILQARDSEYPSAPLTFFYPLWEKQALQNFKERLKPYDEDFGRISKESCYLKYSEARLVISIPKSDSSPRSVYEAIFCGAPVACAASGWVEDLPQSMRQRVYIIDPEYDGWLMRALEWADSIVSVPFVPCEHALSNYDQYAVANKIFHRFYLPIIFHQS